MTDSILNITPTPDVLIALTNTPLKPLDAICELIDNAIDAFRSATLEGSAVEHPWIQIHVPGEAEVRRGEGVIRIADNGSGLTTKDLEGALTAGFSTKNQFDTLGLFGMGFNIASGKLGQKTVVISARKSDNYAIQTTLDLPTLVRNRSFELSIQQIEKPRDFVSGTIVEISGWWPEGTQNSGFVSQLAKISKPKLAGQIGRRYASILRRSQPHQIQMRLNEDPVHGFEHCVWDESRFVERQGWGRIPAKFTFDQVLSTQRQCIVDRSVIPGGTSTCAQCGGADFKSIEHRVRGWVGVQRFDDSDSFGVDVVRNGRAILVGEKEAFFSLIDEVGQKSREYPSDGIYGRIVGEINLDHVPVDFTKQDFQRSSDSWREAMEFIRGFSLLEGKWEGDYRNTSPIGKLFKGYRKVRKPGREDMYMGRYDEAQQRSVRISRDIEKSYFAEFEKRTPGYYDDAKWWELVEEATTPPIRGLHPCPNCSFQNQIDDEECNDCGALLRTKPCVECEALIKVSATSCGMCGTSQVPLVDSPWTCVVCAKVNPVDDESCGICGFLRGTENPISPEVLERRGTSRIDLSFDNKSFTITSGIATQPLSLEVIEVPRDSIVPVWNKPPLPCLSVKSMAKLRVFIDPAHFVFTRFGMPIQMILATEVGQYLQALNPEIPSAKGNSVANIASIVLSEVWADDLAWTQESLAQELLDLFTQVSESLLHVPETKDYFGELTAEEQGIMTTKLIAAGNLDNLDAYSKSGQYLAYVHPASLIRFFGRYPDSWFGTVWNETLPGYKNSDNPAIEDARLKIIRSYQRALEDCADYISMPVHDETAMRRVRSSIEFAKEKLK